MSSMLVQWALNLRPKLTYRIHFPRVLPPGEWTRYYSEFLYDTGRENHFAKMLEKGEIVFHSNQIKAREAVWTATFRDCQSLEKWFSLTGDRETAFSKGLTDLGFWMSSSCGHEFEIARRARNAVTNSHRRLKGIFVPEYSTRFDVELSTRCVSHCPCCARVREVEHAEEWNHGFMPREKLMRFLRASPGISQLSFCGGYGDPIYHPELHQILQDVQSEFPDIFFTLDTNGSHRSSEWWERLGGIIGPRHHVNFSIDGLRDTNGLYRRGTDWDSILAGAKSFRSTFRGRMLWKWIVFRHNQHQVVEGARFAKELGFDSFLLVDSGRHYDDSRPTIPVADLEAQIAAL